MLGLSLFLLRLVDRAQQELYYVLEIRVYLSRPDAFGKLADRLQQAKFIRFVEEILHRLLQVFLAKDFCVCLCEAREKGSDFFLDVQVFVLILEQHLHQSVKVLVYDVLNLRLPELLHVRKHDVKQLMEDGYGG